MNAGLMTNENSNASKFEYQELPPEIARQIYTMNTGEISHPFTLIDQKKNKEICAIVKLKSKTDVHKANLTDDYQVVREMYETQLKANFIEEWIKKKQQETYVSIDPEWQGCDFHYPGWVR